MLIQDTNFTNNVGPGQFLNSSLCNCYNYNVVTVDKLRDVKIIDCTFIMNKQTALLAIESTHVIFSGNNGIFGGAIMLQSGSTFYLMPHTHVQITNNHARRGGGSGGFRGGKGGANAPPFGG